MWFGHLLSLVPQGWHWLLRYGTVRCNLITSRFVDVVRHLFWKHVISNNDMVGVDEYLYDHIFVVNDNDDNERQETLLVFWTGSEYYSVLQIHDTQKSSKFDNSVPLVIFLIFKDNNEWIGYYFIVFVIIQFKSFQTT